MLFLILFTKPVQNDNASKTSTNTQRYAEGWDRIFGQRSESKTNPDKLN